MILSAYTVETSANGFAPCWWACTSKKQARDLARKLSATLPRDQYPNAFHVVDGRKSIAKFFMGEEKPTSWS